MVSLFDRSVLENLDLNSVEENFNPKINALEQNGLRVRPLKSDDFDSGYINLLAQLTEVGKVSKNQFIDTFNKMKHHKDTYYITVIEDTNNGQVIGTGTLFIEQKFIHGCALRGRLEDVVILDQYRGKQLGKLMIYLLKQLSYELGCYKVTLECKDSNRHFYECLGFKKEDNNSNFMQIRFR